ncbi:MULTISPECIES: prepilin peptidase-dependent protein [Lonsdalea]|uniref:Peptidase n=2 Tax=Lonsdalea TaxID=1082702 RepID=A0ACD1JB32_9GAMM|nr:MULTISPECIES: prepilin peptidase-dependent protein [Lonsdalea]OSN01332.1 peptidase [Lonsdalea populi]QPQ25014.1 prepilin peptidase-dependent protein [Lonsdalea populi]RAT12254.1 peptidase [Lonsdalea quercina]RAT17379.1 peptidase [Lonsdalea populi]RAT17442.1 peptidase [Lonsdalea quercina]
MKKCNGWQQGFTLLELVMVIAVISLLVGTGLHSWLGYRQAMLLEQNARQLMGVVARIQTQANWRNATLTAQIHRIGERWCVGPGTSGGDCPADSALFFTATSRDVELVDATAQQFSFFGLRHTAQSGHLTLRSAAGRVRLVLSVRGRLRLCSEGQPLLSTPIC